MRSNEKRVAWSQAMKLLLNGSDKFICLERTIHFFKKHFLIITTLGLIAAFGRVIQLGGFGEISIKAHILLEVVIESARLLLFLYVLGLADVKTGVRRVRNVFNLKRFRKLRGCAFMRTLQTKGVSILVNLLGFSVAVLSFNYLINLAAYQTCFLINLKNSGILTESSSEWTIILFLKNLTVIPFTLVFETLLLLFIANRLNEPLLRRA